MSVYLDREAVDADVSDSQGEESDEIPMTVSSRLGKRGRRLNFLDEDSSSAIVGTGEKRVQKSTSRASTSKASTSKARSESDSIDLLTEIRRNNKLLSTLLDRADSTEDRLKQVEEKLENFGGESSASSTPTS